MVRHLVSTVAMLVAVLLLFGCTSQQLKSYGILKDSDSSKASSSGTKTVRASGGGGVDITEALAAPPAEQETAKSAEISDVVLQYQSCILQGRNTIQCKFLLTSKYQDRDMRFDVTRRHITQLFDDVGNQYLPSRIQVGNRSKTSFDFKQKLPADIPIKMSIRFDNFSTQASKIRRVDVGILMTRGSRARTIFRFINIPLR